MTILKKCSCGKEHKLLPANAKPQFMEEVIIGYCFECECQSTVHVLKFLISEIKEMMADGIL